MVTDMKKKYDFSKAVKGKFFTPESEIELPIYLDKNIRNFYSKVAQNRNKEIGNVINAILKKEMEILKECAGK